MAAIGDTFEFKLPSKHNSKCKCHALNSFKCEEISSYSCDGENMFLPDDSQIRFVKKYMSHFAYACKMRYPLDLVLEIWEYLWFY